MKTAQITVEYLDHLGTDMTVVNAARTSFGKETGSLLFWSRVCNQRMDSHAQKAANELASKISAFAQQLFPVSWDALVG